MILQKLNDYYERLATDPDQEIAPFGYSVQKMSFCAVVPLQGNSVQFRSLVSEVSNGRPISHSLVVPGQSKPSGSGVNPCFLWDNAAYMLGYRADDPKPERTRQTFEAFRDRHLSLESAIGDPHFSAVCRFLEWWQPERVAEHPELAEIAQSFGCFRIQGEIGYVHQRPAVREWWGQQDSAEDSRHGICLVSGKQRTIARLHSPKIKGVRGAQTAGAAIVSFNLDAFDSYGMQQSFNSPVSEQATFQYATALNLLLSDASRTVMLGDSTTIFWTESPTQAETFFPSIFSGSPPASNEAEDTELKTQLAAFFKRLAQGKQDDLAHSIDDVTTPFYVLGLSPNAARISIRYWLASTVGQMSKHLARYVNEVELVNSPDPTPPTVRQLLRETARDAKDIPPVLAGSLMHAILTGGSYPLAFYQAILRRIRAEQLIDKDFRKDWIRALHRRIAAIKAVLVRNFKKEISVGLDTTRPEPAYHLGRWFALLEKIQRDAQGENLNATIKDRFFTAASSTPASVFPRLISLSQHHLNSIESKGLRISRERQVQEIADRLQVFPPHLNLEDQGLFHLGYYHQVQDLYTKKSASKSIPSAAESE